MKPFIYYLCLVATAISTPLTSFTQEIAATAPEEMKKAVIEAQDGGHRARAICDLAASRGYLDVLVTALENPNVDVKYHVITLMDKFSIDEKKIFSVKLLSISLWMHPDRIDGEERVIERRFDEESRRFIGNVLSIDLSKETLFDAKTRQQILSELRVQSSKEPDEKAGPTQASTSELSHSVADIRKPVPVADPTTNSVRIYENGKTNKNVILATVFIGVVIFVGWALWRKK